MSAWEFYLIFGFGLVSSLHCVQMCGPVVLSFSLPLGAHEQSRTRLSLAHVAYNFGRIITYGMLGAIAGLLGSATNLTARLAGFENAAAIVIGVLMILAGLLLLNILPQRYLQRLDPLRLTTRLLKPMGRRITSVSITSKFTLGLMLGFLPCGLIYAALLKAMATGSPLAGVLTMWAFGLGTMSALLAVGVFTSAFSLRLNRWGSRLAAISIVLLGTVIMLRGVMPAMATRTVDKTVVEGSCHH